METSSAFYSSLLGPVSEPSLTIAVDTSASMYHALSHVRHSLQQWLQACSRAPFAPPRLNLLAFDTVARRWQPRVVELTLDRLQSAIGWLKSLRCSATSNLADGLAAALGDSCSQALYLLTDGSPSDWGSRELLRRLSTWNCSLQPIHVILVCPDDGADPVHRIAATWRSDSNSQESTQRVLDFYSELARRSFGSVRRVRLPDPRERQGPSAAEVLVDFRTTASRSTSPTGRYHILNATPRTPTNGVSARHLSPIHTEEAAGTFHKTFVADAGAGDTVDGLQVAESQPARPAAADFIKGLRVLAKSDENGLYCLGHVQEQIDNDRVIVLFDEDRDRRRSSSPKHKTPQGQVTALGDLLSFNDARRLPVGITDRILVPRKKHSMRFVPATVLRQINEAHDGGVQFLVAQHHGELSTVEAHRIVHISASRYERAVEAMLDKRKPHPQATQPSADQEMATTSRSTVPSEPSSDHHTPDWGIEMAQSPSTLVPNHEAVTPAMTPPLHPDPPVQDHNGVTVSESEESDDSWKQTTLADRECGTKTVSDIIDHDPDWPEPVPDPGQLLNVSAEYQAGFAAGFAAGQKTRDIVRVQETFTPTAAWSAEQRLSGTAERQKQAQTRAAESRSQRWQYWGNRPSTAPGRITLQQTPSHVDNIPKLAGHSHLQTSPPHLQSSVQHAYSSQLTNTPKPLHPTFVKQQERLHDLEEQTDSFVNARSLRQQQREAHFHEAQQFLRDREDQRMVLKREQYNRRALEAQEQHDRDEQVKQRAPLRRLPSPKGSVEKEDEVVALERLRLSQKRQQAEKREKQRIAANTEWQQRQQQVQDGRKQRITKRQQQLDQQLKEERLSAQQRHQLKIRNASIQRQKELAMEEHEQHQRDTEDFLRKRAMQEWANHTQY